MFSDFLKRELDSHWAHQHAEMISKCYQVAEISIKICYWSAYWCQQYQNALEHLIVDKEPHQTFTLFVMPSAALDASQSMIEVRKRWLARICKQKDVDPDKANTQQIYTKCHEDFFYLIDMKNHYALWVTNSHNQIHNWYKASPFQHLLQELMAQLGKQMTHAAVIAKDNQGILLTGASGAGKTTTTLLALKHGYHYVSEDYCILSRYQEQLHAYSLYNTIKMTQETQGLFSNFLDSEITLAISTSNKTKIGYFLSKQTHIPIQRKVRIKAICNLQITQQPIPTLSPQKPQESLKSLAFSTLYQNPIYTSQSLSNFHSYLNDAPSYLFSLSTNMDKNMECIDELFKQFSP